MRNNTPLVILLLLLLWILTSCGSGASGGGGGSSSSSGGGSGAGGGSSSSGGGTPPPAANKTEIVSVSSIGTQGNNASSAPSISSDGRYVAFESTANNLITGDTNGAADIFVHDRDTDADGIFDEPGAISTTRMSVSSGGIQGNNTSSAPSISSDGRYVAFESAANNLVAGDTRGVQDIFVHDRDTDADGVFDEPGAISTTRISVSSSGTEGNNASSAPSISPDGRYVAFESAANNLIAGDTNGAVRDIFVRDRDTDNDGVFDEPGAVSTVIVSVSSDGTQGNNGSSAPSISSDGRYVAFESAANNLVAGDTNGTADIFVHDRDADENGIFDEQGAGATSTIRVSVSSSGTQGNNASSAPFISVDGRYVAFESLANNLVIGDTRGVQDIFVHDRDTDADGVFDEPGAISTTRISVSSGGTEGNNASSAPSISADGRYVTFESAANNLVAGDTRGVQDIFVHDRDTDADGVFDEPGAISTTRISVSSSGTEGNNASSAPSISPDGRYVTFESAANNLVAGDTNGTVRDIFVNGP